MRDYKKISDEELEKLCFVNADKDYITNVISKSKQQVREGKYKVVVSVTGIDKEVLDKIENRGIRKGWEKGLQEGHQAGLREGHQAGLREGIQDGRIFEYIDLRKEDGYSMRKLQLDW